MSQSNGTANGRDEKGRFSRGNTYGKGNPFARQTAQLRKAFVDMVSEQDVRDIVAVLMLKAKGGDLAAARLVLSYAIGRPAEAENPDRLDADEWSAWSSRMTDPRQVQEWLSGAPLDYFNKVAPILLDVQTQSCANEYNRLWQLKHPEEYEQHMREKAKEQEAEPSTNGGDGNDACGPDHNTGASVGRPDHKTEEQEPAPSRNGSTGERKEAAAPSANGANGTSSPAGSPGLNSVPAPSTNGGDRRRAKPTKSRRPRRDPRMDEHNEVKNLQTNDFV